MFGSRQFKSREEKLKYYEEWKLSFIPEILNSEIPAEFISYLNYTKAMNILDNPEYDVWKKTFKQLLIRNGGSLNDFQYEWIPKIKAEMASMQIANSLLNDLDITPTVSASSQIQVSSLKQGEVSQEKQEDSIESGGSIQLNYGTVQPPTTHGISQNKPLHQILEAQMEESRPPISNEVPQKMEETLHLDNNKKSVILDSGAYYGAIDLDNIIDQKQSHPILCGDSEQKFNANSVHNANNNINNTTTNNNNGSILDFSLYQKKGTMRSHSLTQKNHMAYNSADDLSVYDDESENSLFSQFQKNQVNFPLPFNFKHHHVPNTE